MIACPFVHAVISEGRPASAAQSSGCLRFYLVESLGRDRSKVWTDHHARQLAEMNSLSERDSIVVTQVASMCRPGTDLLCRHLGDAADLSAPLEGRRIQSSEAADPNGSAWGSTPLECGRGPEVGPQTQLNSMTLTLTDTALTVAIACRQGTYCHSRNLTPS